MKNSSRSLLSVFFIVAVLSVSIAPVWAFSFQEFGDKISKEAQKLRRGAGIGGEAPVCEAGSHQKSEDSMACVLCPLGTFSDAKGATACTACPEGKTTLKIGASSKDTCVVPPEPQAEKDSAAAQ